MQKEIDYTSEEGQKLEKIQQCTSDNSLNFVDMINSFQKDKENKLEEKITTFYNGSTAQSWQSDIWKNHD